MFCFGKRQQGEILKKPSWLREAMTIEKNTYFLFNDL